MCQENKRVVAATIGTILEWAEYTFYGYMAYKISDLFFPKQDELIGMLSTFGIFAAGFLMRPLGGLIFGQMGDRIGRKKTLIISVYLMAISTVCIGILPTYSQIGIAAPLLLLICRLIQGLAVAGEFNGASIFLIEHAPKERAYLSGCWAGAAAAAGMLVGAFSAAVVTLPFMPVWAWRLPFFLGFVGCLVALYLRHAVEESPVFRKVQLQNTISQKPILDVFKNYKSEMVQVALFAAFICTWVYLCNLYYKVFLIKTVGIDEQMASWLTTFGQALVVVLYPVVGVLSDKLNGTAFMRNGLFAGIIVAPIIFWFGTVGDPILIGFGQALYALVGAAVGSPMFKYFFDLFPTSVRYTGISFSWSISAAIFGGTAPMLAQYMVGTFDIPLAPAFYVSLSAFIALCLLQGPENFMSKKRTLETT